MRCSVVCLRRFGMRLKPRELGEAVAGDLEVTDHAGPAEFKRIARVANLWIDAGGGTRCSLLAPLWEPTVLRIGADSLTLLGIELATVKGRLHEHTQVWRCLTVPMPAGQVYAARRCS
jgi:hypothetical protein